MFIIRDNYIFMHLLNTYYNLNVGYTEKVLKELKSSRLSLYVIIILSGDSKHESTLNNGRC